MIPKIVHYCWFGGKPKPENIRSCIDSWKRHLPDYRFMEWNEENFDFNAMAYTRKAYEAKKFAFVSDVARLKALCEYGGIYLDTDVEVLKPFDDILNHRCVLGMEERNYIATSFIAAEPNFPLINKFLSDYDQAQFDISGSAGVETNVKKLTKILEDKGFIRENKRQEIGDITIFPKEYFSPYDYINCVDLRTENTYCVHYFYITWQSNTVKIKKAIKKVAAKILGKKRMDFLRGYHE